MPDRISRSTGASQSRRSRPSPRASRYSVSSRDCGDERRRLTPPHSGKSHRRGHFDLDGCISSEVTGGIVAHVAGSDGVRCGTLTGTVSPIHYLQGLTMGAEAFAANMRGAVHTTHLPDLYDGLTFDILRGRIYLCNEDGTRHSSRLAPRIGRQRHMVPVTECDGERGENDRGSDGLSWSEILREDCPAERGGDKGAEQSEE